MATLADVARAELRVGSEISLLSAEGLGAVARGLLASVGPLYGYGISGEETLPKLELSKDVIVKGFRSANERVDALEVAHNALVITDAIAHQYQILFRHLPDAVTRDGWDKDLLDVAGYACRMLACASYEKSMNVLNLLYHSVISDSRTLDTFSPSMAASFLRILNRWEDLTHALGQGSSVVLNTSYFTSMVPAAREIAKRSAERLESVTEAMLEKDHQLARAVASARGLIAQSPNLRALLAE